MLPMRYAAYAALLKSWSKSPVDKVVVYDGYADDGSAAMKEAEGYEARQGGAQDKGTFSTEVKGSKHRAYAIAYDDEDDMLHEYRLHVGQQHGQRYD